MSNTVPNNHPFTLLVTAASDPKIPCERVMRAALFVAKTVKDENFSTWCELELNGYFNTKRSELPGYRWLTGIVMVRNRFGQDSPGIFKSAKDQEWLSRSPVVEPLGQVEKNANAPKETEFSVQFSPELSAQLRKDFGDAADVFRVVRRIGFENIVTDVRQRTFMWAIEGINRDVPPGLDSTVAALLGVTHAQTPRQVPEPVQANMLAAGTINVHNSNLLFHSPGATANAVHHQGIDHSALVQLVTELRQAVEAVAPASRPTDLVDALAELKGLSEMKTPRLSFVKEALASLRSVLEGGAGAVLGELAKPHILALMTNVMKG